MVRGYTGATPYARVGNWLVVVLALVSLLAVLAAAKRRTSPEMVRLAS
jgi:apolipoprotein N-acyltransferase